MPSTVRLTIFTLEFAELSFVVIKFKLIRRWYLMTSKSLLE